MACVCVECAQGGRGLLTYFDVVVVVVLSVVVIVRGEKEERKKDSHPPSWLYNSTLSLSLRLLLLLLYTRNFHLGFFFFFSLSPFSPVCIHCAPRHFLTGPFSTWTDVAPLSNAQSPSSFRAGRVFSRPLFVFFFRLSSFYQFDTIVAQIAQAHIVFEFLVLKQKYNRKMPSALSRSYSVPVGLIQPSQQQRQSNTVESSLGVSRRRHHRPSPS